MAASFRGAMRSGVAVLARSESAVTPARSIRHSTIERIRALPIRWRIAAIAALNAAVLVLLAALIWDGAHTLSSASGDLQQARRWQQLLVSLESETARLQSLIHRQSEEPQPNLLAEIERRRTTLLNRLQNRSAAGPAIAASLAHLSEVTNDFLEGFARLRASHASITEVYEREVASAARDLPGLFAAVEAATAESDTPLRPLLGQSRDALSRALIAADGFYLSRASHLPAAASKALTDVERGIQGMRDAANGETERNAVAQLATRAAAWRAGLDHLAALFSARSELLRTEIDGGQAAMMGAIERTGERVRAQEEQAQRRFDAALSGVYIEVGLVVVAFLALIVFIGVAIAGSISGPLRELKSAMQAIVAGDYERPVRGTRAQDEIGEMARAVEVFRENATAHRSAEQELRNSKERAENALADLRDMQKSLIEAEKLAALGGLVAGVAHEVNNPVGISLTVASSLARRNETFAAELAAGQIRRARLDEFVSGTREASQQLVANLERAGELIQAFKQVAVDRSHESRRQFDLRQSTEQIVASLRPGLRRAQIGLTIEVADGITLDSYPGAYGQVLTNLMLNAAGHGFAGRSGGTIRIEGRMAGPLQAEIVFSDDGTGMSEEVQRRAFEPFFTTKRNQGGTGLGLHIVYNIVTRRLGGRIVLSSAPNRGTTFRLTLALVAPRQEAGADQVMAVMDR
jgi:signal transduction histidine kinase